MNKINESESGKDIFSIQLTYEFKFRIVFGKFSFQIIRIFSFFPTITDLYFQLFLLLPQVQGDKPKATAEYYQPCTIRDDFNFEGSFGTFNREALQTDLVSLLEKSVEVMMNVTNSVMFSDLKIHIVCSLPFFSLS